MVSRMNRRARAVLLAGLALAGLAATGLLTHRRAPDIVGPGQVIDGEHSRRRHRDSALWHGCAGIPANLHARRSSMGLRTWGDALWQPLYHNSPTSPSSVPSGRTAARNAFDVLSVDSIDALVLRYQVPGSAASIAVSVLIPSAGSATHGSYACWLTFPHSTHSQACIPVWAGEDPGASAFLSFLAYDRRSRKKIEVFGFVISARWHERARQRGRAKDRDRSHNCQHDTDDLLLHSDFPYLITGLPTPAQVAAFGLPWRGGLRTANDDSRSTPLGAGLRVM